MTAVLSIVLILSILGLISVSYAVRHAWQDYTLAARHNGWLLLSARGILRAQVLRFIEVGLITFVLTMALVYPDPRPGYMTTLMRVALLVVIVLISLSAVLDALTRRKVLQSE